MNPSFKKWDDLLKKVLFEKTQTEDTNWGMTSMRYSQMRQTGFSRCGSSKRVTYPNKLVFIIEESEDVYESLSKVYDKIAQIVTKNHSKLSEFYVIKLSDTIKTYFVDIKGRGNIMYGPLDCDIDTVEDDEKLNDRIFKMLPSGSIYKLVDKRQSLGNFKILLSSYAKLGKIDLNCIKKQIKWMYKRDYDIVFFGGKQLSNEANSNTLANLIKSNPRQQGISVIMNKWSELKSMRERGYRAKSTTCLGFDLENEK